MSDSIDHNILKLLDKPNQADGFPVVVVTKECFMRGYDYRGPTRGLCLIVAKAFATQRDLE